jgi:hypothetical protein
MVIACTDLATLRDGFGVCTGREFANYFKPGRQVRLLTFRDSWVDAVAAARTLEATRCGAEVDPPEDD